MLLRPPLKTADLSPLPTLRPIPWMVSIGLAMAFPAWAAQPSLQPSWELSTTTPKAGRSQPGFLIADHIEGQTDETMIARGHVELRKRGNLMWTDELTYWPLDDIVEAKGNVRVKQGGNEFAGPFMRRNLTDMTGYFEHPSYLIRREIKRKQDQQNMAPGVIGLNKDVPDVRVAIGSGDAEKLDFIGENHLSLKQATYSSCRPDQRDWYLRSSELDLNYDADNGQSTHSRVYFKDVPILYWPSISFPLNQARRSGFLPPTFVATTKDGMDVTIPYYLNLAPDYDLLLKPRLIGQRGNQLGAELRYQDYNYRGELRFETLNDSKYGDVRQAYNLNHIQNLGQGVMANVQWNGVSDGDYFNDLSTSLIQTSQVVVPRQITLTYAPSPWIVTTTRYLTYQVLKSDVTKPYTLEPQIHLVGRQPDFYGTDLQLTGQFTQFSHPTNVQGRRMVAYPQITIPYESPAYFFRPKFGIHGTQYELNTQGLGNASESRVLPTFTLDTGAVFERNTTFGGRATIQTLEPRLYYVNIPYKDQSRLPVFDSAVADFNFAQIFSENRYLGYDRISDANQLTGAVATRLIDEKTGAERMKAMIGQRYYFSKQQVTLNSIYPNMPTEVARLDNFSSIIAAFSGLVAYRTYLESAWEYSYKEQNTMRYSVGARYQPSYGKVLTATYRFNRDQATLTNQIDQYDIAGQWPLSGRWYLVGRYNYSLQDKRTLETIAGFEYNAGCWMARVVTQKIETTAGQPNTVLFFQLELNDFGALGTNPIQTLRRSIPGYGKINEVDAGSLIQ